jgi:hypothetical protein
VRQSHPRQRVGRHGEHVAQHVDLKLVKVLVDVRLEQRLELVHAVLNLALRLRRRLGQLARFGGIDQLALDAVPTLASSFLARCCCCSSPSRRRLLLLPPAVVLLAAPAAALSAAEAEGDGLRVEQRGFEGADGLVEQLVDGVDDVVDEGL